MSGFTDAQRNNDISRNVRQYRDLDLFFGRKPVSGDVNILTDVENIKRAVRNLILLSLIHISSPRDVEESRMPSSA